MTRGSGIILFLFVVIAYLFATGRYLFPSPDFGKTLKHNDLSGKKLLKNPLDHH